MYKILCKDGSAKRGQLETVHGTVQTPVFMNVGTVGAMKGAVATTDLLNLKTQIVLSNTYHQPCVDGFRWISGVFSGRTSKDKRRGRLFSFAY